MVRARTFEPELMKAFNYISRCGVNAINLGKKLPVNIRLVIPA